jgi:hypothetical protein
VPLWRQAIVSAVDAGPPPSVTLDMDGAETGPIRYLDSLAPVVGDTVWLLANDSDKTVVGKLAVDVTPGLHPTLVTTPDGGFPAAVTDATTATHVANRITIASVAYARLLIVTSHTLCRYSQAGAIQASVFVNSTQIGQFRLDFNEVDIYESFCPGGQFQLPASTAGVVEVRFHRITGTGAWDVINTETYFQVSHQRSA